MRTTTIPAHLPIEELKERMTASKSRQQFQRWQVIYILALMRIPASQVAAIVGVTTGTVYQWANLYRNKGPKALELTGRGGRRGGLLTLAEEESLLAGLYEKASKGLVITARAVRLLVEKKLGRNVSKDYSYDLLQRHGWRKIAPRPYHPKGNPEAQEEFKKNCPASWRPQRGHSER